MSFQHISDQIPFKNGPVDFLKEFIQNTVEDLDATYHNRMIIADSFIKIIIIISANYRSRLNKGLTFFLL